MKQTSDESIEHELETFDRQVSRLMDAFLFPHEHRSRSRTWRPPTDVYETDHAVIVKIEVAGMNPEDFRISFVDRLLTVSGVRQDFEAKLSYHCLEIPYGEFLTRVLIPGAYREDKIEAKYENGYLYVTLPKSNDEHRIPVRKVEVKSVTE